MMLLHGNIVSCIRTEMFESTFSPKRQSSGFGSERPRKWSSKQSIWILEDKTEISKGVTTGTFRPRRLPCCMTFSSQDKIIEWTRGGLGDATQINWSTQAASRTTIRCVEQECCWTEQLLPCFATHWHTFGTSMLTVRFSGQWDDSLEKDKDGEFFIERDPDLFVTSSSLSVRSTKRHESG